MSYNQQPSQQKNPNDQTTKQSPGSASDPKNAGMKNPQDRSEAYQADADKQAQNSKQN